MKSKSEATEGLQNRIKRCAELAGSGDALSQKSAIPRRTLETYLAGNAEPKASRVAAIANAVGVSAHWLITGEGPMLLSDQQLPEGNKDGEFSYVTRWNIEVSAGHGASDPEHEVKLEDVAFRKDWLSKQGLTQKELAIFTARGDSMEPTIQHNDMLLVKVFPQWRHETAPDEGIYIIRIDGHLHAKRIQSDGLGGILVKSDNQAYDTIHIDKDRLPDVDIVGRVVWIGRSMT